MATLHVQPRQTPGERDDHPLELQVDEDITALAQTIDDDIGGELVLVFEERDGIAKAARATATGLAVELHHILTFT